MSTKHRYLSPLEKFYQWEQERPNQDYLIQPYDGKVKRYTYKEAGQEIRRMANHLRSLDLPSGSHIALISKNCAHWIMTDLAIMMSGHVSIPLYPNLNAATIQQILTHSGAKLLFVGKLDKWAEMEPGVPGDVEMITFPFYGHSGMERWEDIIAQSEPIEENVVRDDEDLATIVYTSGTTGMPKGVMHKFSSFGYASTNAMAELDIDYEPRFFSYLPLAHIAERVLVEMGGLYTGGKTFFAQSLDTFNRDMNAAKPTLFLGVPRIWTKFQQAILAKMPQKKLNRLLKVPFLNSYIKKKILTGLGLEQCRVAFTGAAPTPKATMEWYQALGLPLHEAYGMTENMAYSHLNRPGNTRFGSAGQAQPHVITKISEEGEILIKNDCLLTGYYREPEITAETVVDGFLRTGDKGEIDKDGFLFITGRVKDLFKTEKGKYVAPAPIELTMARNSMIEQVCVVGTSIPQPIALVVLSEEGKKDSPDAQEASLEETMNLINPDLDHHEQVAKIVIVKDEWTPENELLTPTMKIKRNAIEKKYGTHFKEWYEAPGKVCHE